MQFGLMSADESLALVNTRAESARVRNKTVQFVSLTSHQALTSVRALSVKRKYSLFSTFYYF